MFPIAQWGGAPAEGPRGGGGGGRAPAEGPGGEAPKDYTKPRQIIQSPYRLYKPPKKYTKPQKDYTKPRQTIQRPTNIKQKPKMLDTDTKYQTRVATHMNLA